MVSARTIRRSQLTFSWYSACHIHVTLARIAGCIVFYLPEKPAQQFVKIQAKLDAIHVLTKEEYTVWWLQYTPFSFLFVFFFLVSAWQLQRSGWEGRSTSAKFMPQRCWPAPTLPRNTFLYVPSYVPSPSSWAKESENHSKHQYIIVDVKVKNASFPKTCPNANCVFWLTCDQAVLLPKFLERARQPV